MHFYRKSINVLSSHMHSALLSLSHTCQAILSCSIDVSSLDDAREDWDLHGWSSKWLIASLVCILHSQLKITCHLFSGLSHQFPQEFCTSSFIMKWLCACVIVHMCVCVGRGWVLAPGDPYIAVSMRRRRGFVLGPLSLRINSALLRVRPKSEATVEEAKRHTLLL